MSKPIINGAVIGYGGQFNMGGLHLKCMAANGITPYAACDIDPARVEAAKTDFPGIKTFTDYREMLKDPDLHIAAVILPHNLHHAACVDVLSSGKHCICEKPFTLTVAEADEIVHLSKSTGKTMAVFHNRRFDPDHLAKMKLIGEGAIGEVFHIEAGMANYAKPRDWWRSDKRISGGNLYDWGVHFTDWILDLIPDPIESVTAWYQKRVWSGYSNEDETMYSIRFKSGKYANLQISGIAAAPIPRFRILGTKGAILQSHEWSNTFTLTRVEEDKPVDETIDFDAMGYGDSAQAWYADLAGHLINGTPLTVPVEAARRNIAVIEASERSAISRKPEPVAHEE